MSENKASGPWQGSFRNVPALSTQRHVGSKQGARSPLPVLADTPGLPGEEEAWLGSQEKSARFELALVNDRRARVRDALPFRSRGPSVIRSSLTDSWQTLAERRPRKRQGRSRWIARDCGWPTAQGCSPFQLAQGRVSSYWTFLARTHYSNGSSLLRGPKTRDKRQVDCRRMSAALKRTAQP
jgi:hypothetical protein